MAKHVEPQSLVTERDLNEEIAKVAYDLYKKRGMTDGHHYEDWLEAEKIVMKEYAKLKKEEIDLMSEVAEKKASERVAKKQAKSR
jgi:1-aminocyclopropane-1-carboxylate deaminase/D-cysteine desulfhydrase-like pyridoxal-dependent ACC family enzyme